MTRGQSTISLDQLLTLCLAGERVNASRLDTEAKRYARAITKARAPELPDDLHEDIAQQAFCDLWERKATVLEGKTALEAYRDAVVTAIRAIRAAHAPAGCRSRRTARSSFKVDARQVEQIPNRADQAKMVREGVGEKPIEAWPCLDAPKHLKAVEDRLDVEKILDAAPSMIKTALQLIHMQTVPVDTVAQIFTISRFTLNREIGKFVKSWRSAA